MENEREIKLYTTDLDFIIETLLKYKAKGEHVYCVYSGATLHSDTVTVDSAYIAVTGLTKDEFKKSVHASLGISPGKREKAEKMIPVWIERGKTLIYSLKHEKWEETVRLFATGLYYGEDVEIALEIMEALEKDEFLEDAINIFNSKGSTTKAADAIRDLVLEFSKRGPEFYVATAKSELTLNEIRAIETKREENEIFASIYSKPNSGTTPKQ